MSAKTGGGSSKKYIWLLFALLVVVVYFSGLTIPLLGPDEPRYTQVAREMFERGDWVTPTLGGYNWFEKPALLYWLQIVSFHLFGVTEFAARFGSALFGLGTVVSIWLLGRAVERKMPAEYAGSDFANWLALIAATTIGIIAFAHAASFDIILTFPITASLVCFFIWELNATNTASPRGNFSPSLLGFYFFIGLALLAKGLVGIVFPFAIVSFYYLLSWKSPAKTLIVSLFWGTALAVLISCSWYVPMYQTHSWSFIDEFFIQHHFQRYTSNKYLHPQPFFFFLWVLPLMTIPWLPFFIGSLWNFIPKKASATVKSEDGALITASPRHSVPPSLKKVRLFAVAWLLVPLVFFSFSGSKLPGYVLPALPAAMILAGEYAWRFTRKSNTRRLIVQIVAAGTLVIVFISATFLVNEFAAHESVKALIAKADAEGHSKERVINLFGMSHNSEFYAPRRLVRTPDGKQKMYFSVAEIVDELKAKKETSGLVLVPLRHLEILTKYPHVESSKIADNEEFALMAVTIK